MTQSFPLPIWATVKAAYRDVFGNLGGFIKVIWLVLVMMVLFVELPMLITQREVYYSIHPEKRIEANLNGSSSPIDLPETEKPSTDKPAADKPAAEKPAEDKKLADEKAEPRAVTMEDASRVNPEHVMIMMALSLLQLVIMFSFSTAWYRQLLLGFNQGKTILFHFGKMEWNFALTSMKSGLVLAPIMLVLMSYYMASIPGFSEGEPINITEYWPLFAGGVVLMLYLVSRLSMSYPLTMMGQLLDPVRQSWDMTKAQGGRIMLGFICVGLPITLLTVLLVVGLDALLNLGVQSIPEATSKAGLEVGFAQHLLYKTIGSAYMLFAFALVSAFYARAYAFLVRSQQAAPPT